MSLKDIYKKAGVVMKPAAIKEGKLYSQQPHSGAGDFNFSRADGVQTRINKHGLIETVANNEPRLSYDLVDGKVSDCPHLLLEQTRTNQLQRSEEFDNSYWNKSLISVENSHISPDGSASADKIVSGNSTGNHFFRRTSLTYAATDNTFSVFAKSTDDLFEQFHFIIYDGSNHSAYFDVKNGSVVSADSGVTASMVKYGNGWYRCIATYQTASTSVGQIKVELGSTSTIAGDGSSGMLFWGMMWETGSYATSYIPTSGSTETRQVEFCNGSGNSETFNDLESSWFLDIEAPYEDTSFNRYITISDGGSSPYSNYLMLQYRNNGTMRIFHNGVDFADAIHIGGSSFDQAVRHRIAIRYKEGDMKVYVDGVAQSLNGSFVYQSISGLNEIKFDLNGATSAFHAKVHEISTFTEALTDSELELLTTS